MEEHDGEIIQEVFTDMLSDTEVYAASDNSSESDFILPRRRNVVRDLAESESSDSSSDELPATTWSELDNPRNLEQFLEDPGVKNFPVYRR